MTVEAGQVWVCTDPDCGCEVTVTKPARPGKDAAYPIRCVCGEEMTA